MLGKKDIKYVGRSKYEERQAGGVVQFTEMYQETAPRLDRHTTRQIHHLP